MGFTLLTLFRLFAGRLGTTIAQVSFMPTPAGGTGSAVGFGVSVTSDGGAIVLEEFTGPATFGSTTLTGGNDASDRPDRTV